MTAFVPCSPRHGKHCNPTHASTVLGYRLARYADEIAHEQVLSNPGDKQYWQACGGRLISFADWLKGLRRNDSQT